MRDGGRAVEHRQDAAGEALRGGGRAHQIDQVAAFEVADVARERARGMERELPGSEEIDGLPRVVPRRTFITPPAPMSSAPTPLTARSSSRTDPVAVIVPVLATVEENSSFPWPTLTWPLFVVATPTSDRPVPARVSVPALSKVPPATPFAMSWAPVMDHVALLVTAPVWNWPTVKSPD